MTIFEPGRSELADRMLSVLRIIAAALYIEHGTQKMFDVPPMAGQPVPYHFMSLNGAAGVLETFGGILLILGLLTRPIAFLLAGEMAVAYFKVHLPRSFFPINNRGDNVVLFCFFFLYLTVAGAGVWSLDHVIASLRSKRLTLTRSDRERLARGDFRHGTPRGTISTL